MGQYKVDVAEARIKEINPDAVVHTYKTFYAPQTADQFDFTQYDYVVDAIDTVILGAILGIVLGEKASVLYPIGQIWLNLLFVLLVLLMMTQLFDAGCTLINSCGDTVASMLVTRVLYGKDWFKKGLNEREHAEIGQKKRVTLYMEKQLLWDETHYGDCTCRPDMHGILIPGKRGRILSVLYTAGGEGTHPTVILLHGIPGCERNLDLAQALKEKPVLCIGATMDLYTPPQLHGGPLAQAVRRAGGTLFREVTYPTDHFFADYRLAVAGTVTEFLKGQLPK